MAKLLNYHQHQLSVRLGLWVVSIVTILFVAVVAIIFYTSRQAVKEAAIEKAVKTLDGTVLYIDNILHKAEVATKNMRWNVEHHLDQPELLYTYNRQLLLNNPEIMGSSIAMEPYYYRDKGKLFMAYSYRTAHGDTSIVESDHYGSRPYSEQKWYTIPKDQNRATWVKPIEHDETSRSITCYSVPIRDADRRVVGILSVDISLDSLTNAINKTKPFPNSYCTMLGRQGTFIIHPDSVRLHNQTVYDVLKERPDPELASLVASMMADETGYRNVTIDGCDSYVFYKPFKSESWCAAIVCPTSEIMAANNRLLSVTLFIAAVGLVALLFFCLFIVSRELRPLVLLAESVHRISEGRFDEPIPDTHRHDEVGVLQKSFQTMQQSLSKYIGETRLMATVLEERNDALRLANEQSKEADRVKSAFLHNMTDQLVKPIGEIEHMVEQVKRDYRSLDHNALEQLSARVQQQTLIVTELLDRMLEISQQKGDSQ